MLKKRSEDEEERKTLDDEGKTKWKKRNKAVK